MTGTALADMSMAVEVFMASGAGLALMFAVVIAAMAVDFLFLRSED